MLDSVDGVTASGFTTASTTTPFDLEGSYSFGDHPNTKLLNGGEWSLDTNWNPVAVPTSSVTTTLIFDINAPYTAGNDLGSNLRVNRIVLNANGLTLAGPTGVEFGGATPQLIQGSVNPVVVETPMELAVPAPPLAVPAPDK